MIDEDEVGLKEKPEVTMQIHQKEYRYIEIRPEASGVRAKEFIPNFAIPNFAITNFAIPNFAIPNFAIGNCRLGNGQGVCLMKRRHYH